MLISKGEVEPPFCRGGECVVKRRGKTSAEDEGISLEDIAGGRAIAEDEFGGEVFLE